jgi:hypothetical protein
MAQTNLNPAGSPPKSLLPIYDYRCLAFISVSIDHENLTYETRYPTLGSDNCTVALQSVAAIRTITIRDYIKKRTSFLFRLVNLPLDALLLLLAIWEYFDGNDLCCVELTSYGNVVHIPFLRPAERVEIERHVHQAMSRRSAV